MKFVRVQTHTHNKNFNQQNSSFPSVSCALLVAWIDGFLLLNDEKEKKGMKKKYKTNKILRKISN